MAACRASLGMNADVGSMPPGSMIACRRAACSVALTCATQLALQVWLDPWRTTLLVPPSCAC